MSAQAPADSIVTIVPLTLQTLGEVLANTTGLLEPPPVADTVNVPFGANTGAAGLATKLLILWPAGFTWNDCGTCDAAW